MFEFMVSQPRVRVHLMGYIKDGTAQTRGSFSLKPCDERTIVSVDQWTVRPWTILEDFLEKGIYHGARVQGAPSHLLFELLEKVGSATQGIDDESVIFRKHGRFPRGGEPQKRIYVE
jgi:hypothetical protein